MSSALFELYPLVVAALLWGKEWSATSIIIHCDNEATVHCINKGRSHSPTLMPLLRRLIWISACEQFIITAKHIPGSKNLIADSLSRFAFQKFRTLARPSRPSIANPSLTSPKSTYNGPSPLHSYQKHYTQLLSVLPHCHSSVCSRRSSIYISPQQCLLPQEPFLYPSTAAAVTAPAGALSVFPHCRSSVCSRRSLFYIPPLPQQ